MILNENEEVRNRLYESYTIHIDLKIPEDKLIIEKNMYASNPNAYYLFPFFLRLENEQNIECIVIDEFPNCYYHKYYKSQYPLAINESEKLVLDAKILDFYLDKGLRWVHIDEYETLDQSDYHCSK